MRHLAILGAAAGVVLWATIFSFTQSALAIAMFVVVAAMSAQNVVSLNRKIRHEEGR